MRCRHHVVILKLMDLDSTSSGIPSLKFVGTTILTEEKRHICALAAINLLFLGERGKIPSPKSF